MKARDIKLRQNKSGRARARKVAPDLTRLSARMVEAVRRPGNAAWGVFERRMQFVPLDTALSAAALAKLETKVAHGLFREGYVVDRVVTLPNDPMSAAVFFHRNDMLGRRMAVPALKARPLVETAAVIFARELVGRDPYFKDGTALVELEMAPFTGFDAAQLFDHVRKQLPTSIGEGPGRITSHIEGDRRFIQVTFTPTPKLLGEPFGVILREPLRHG